MKESFMKAVDIDEFKLIRDLVEMLMKELFVVAVDKKIRIY